MTNSKTYPSVFLWYGQHTWETTWNDTFWTFWLTRLAHAIVMIYICTLQHIKWNWRIWSTKDIECNDIRNSVAAAMQCNEVCNTWGFYTSGNSWSTWPLRTKAIPSLYTSQTTPPATWCHVPQDWNPQLHYCRKLNTHMCINPCLFLYQCTAAFLTSLVPWTPYNILPILCTSPQNYLNSPTP